MKKNFKLCLQLVKKEKTDYGLISLKESAEIMKSFGDIAKKLNYDCYVKAEKKEIVDYKPTGKRYELKTLEDVALNISPEQFEVFIEDFRSFCNLKRNISFLQGKSKKDNYGFTWIDDNLNKHNIHYLTN